MSLSEACLQRMRETERSWRERSEKVFRKADGKRQGRRSGEGVALGGAAADFVYRLGNQLDDSNDGRRLEFRSA